MKKIIVGIEGKQRPDGRTINIGALTMTDEMIPVRWAGAVEKPIGNAGNLVRDDDGNIWMDVSLFKQEELVLDNVDAYIYANELVEKGTGNDKQILAGRIRSIDLFMKVGANPGARTE